MPSSGDKRLEQQRARRARALEQARSGGAMLNGDGVSLAVPLTSTEPPLLQPSSEPTSVETRSDSSSDAVASALLEASVVAAKINKQLGEKATAAGARAIAAVLYERQHGGSLQPAGTALRG
jgi:hypothetical protein